MYKIIDIHIRKKFALTINGSFIKKWLKKYKSWLPSEVSNCQGTGSIQSVLQAGYRRSGYKIIIKRDFNKFIFIKRRSMKSWRPALSIWKGVEGSLYFRSKFKKNQNQSRKFNNKNPLIFRCLN